MLRRWPIQPSPRQEDSDKEQVNEDEQEQQRSIAVVNRRDSDMRQLRRHFGYIIRNQSQEIRVFSQKNQILITISLVLLLMVFLTWFSSSSQCNPGHENSKDIERWCLNERQRNNCNSGDKKGLSASKYCQQLNDCLKQPQNYKQKLQKIKWQQFYDDLADYIEFGRINSWWVCLLFLSGAIVNYFKVK